MTKEQAPHAFAMAFPDIPKSMFPITSKQDLIKKLAVLLPGFTVPQVSREGQPLPKGHKPPSRSEE
jgi:hypothetical protein